MKYIQKLAIWLYDTFPLWKNATVLEDLKTLYPMQDITKKQKEYVIEKLSFGIIVLVPGRICPGLSHVCGVLPRVMEPVCRGVSPRQFRFL